MTVRKKCRQGHFFDLTQSMLIPFKNGKAVRANCPDCGTSVILSWKDVADVLGTNIEGAKEFIGGSSSTPQTTPRKTKSPDAPKKFTDPPVIDLSAYGPSEVPSFMKVPEDEPVDEVLRAIEKYEKDSKMTEEPHDEEVEEDNPAPEAPVKSSLDEALDKTPGDILKEVISTSVLEDRAKSELLDYLGYRDKLQPSELQTTLEQYGIPTATAKKIAVRYGFLLNSWNEKMSRANRLSDMMGPLGSIPIPGYNPPFGSPVGNQPPLPGQPPGNMGIPQANQSTIMLMIQSYQMNPQGFMTWLQSNPQYFPLWNQAMAQMQQVPFGMNPMAPQMFNPMMMNPMSQRNGPSREDVKRMISEETGKQVDGLKQYLNQVLQPRGNDNTNVILPILLKLIEERGQQVPPPPQDPNAAMMPSLIQTLLDHTLNNARGDPAMGAVVEELKELKKGFESGGSGASRTIEEFQKMIEAMRLQSQIELDRKKFEQDAISSERNRELIKDTIQNVVPAIGQVVATMAQRGGSAPPMQVMGTSTENTVNLPCNNCGTPIVFPKGAQSVTCPKCGSQYGVEVEKPQETKKATIEVKPQEESESQISEEDPYSFRKEGVF